MHPQSGRVLVLIDTPAGSRNKYKFDPVLKVLTFGRTLPNGMIFPCDFGSVPGTCAEDGDALDALVVGMPPTFPGCLVPTRLLGVIRARQTEKGRTIRNDRLVACAETDVTPAHFRTLRQLGEKRLRAIELFFENYNRAEGRPFRTLGRGSAREAHRAIARARRRFAQAAGTV